MAITTTPRFGFTRWGADGDTQSRADFVANLDALEAAGAMYATGLLADAPAATKVGRFYFATDTNVLYWDNGATWVQVNRTAKTTRITHTFNISGAVDTTTPIPGLVFDVPAGQTVTLVRARHLILSGTSATVKLQKNGADITGWTGISVTPVETLLDAADVTFADGDRLTLVPTAISGTPSGLLLSAAIDYTV